MKLRIYIFTIIVVLLTLSGIGCITVGRGSIDSTVSRFEESGGIYKAWLSDKSKLNDWYGDVYSINQDDSYVINALKEAQNNERPVRITFKKELFILPWEHASKIIITNVEYIE